MKNFVIGSGIVSFKYKNGIITCADTQASYGNLCKFKNITRIYKIGPKTLLNMSGELSDMQNLVKLIRIHTGRDAVEITTNGYCRLVQRILYTKRSNMEPLNVSVNILGVDGNNMVLSSVDHLGNYYYDDITTTGLASMIALPFLRDKIDGRTAELSKEEAIHIAEEAMRIMCYRSCRNSNSVQIGIVDYEGVYISEPYLLDTNWSIALHSGEIVIE